MKQTQPTLEDKAAALRMPLDMMLPIGCTCGDCAHLVRCQGLFGVNPSNDYCDWSPARFRPATTHSNGDDR